MPQNDSRLLIVQPGGVSYPSTPGTVTAADYIQAFDVSPTRIESESVERTVIDSQGGNILAPAITRVHATIEFSVPLSGSGSGLGVPPAMGTLLEACGTSVAIVATTSCTYSLATLNSTTGHCHLTFQHGGNNYKFLNAMGSVSFSFAAAALPFARFQFKGFYEAPAPGTLLTPTYPSQRLARTVDAANTGTFTMGTQATPVPLNFTEFTLDLGNEVTLYDNGGANGKYFAVTNRNPTATLTFLEPDLSVYNVDELHRTQTEQRLRLVHMSGVDGTTITIPRCTLEKFGTGDQNNRITRNGGLTILHSPGVRDDFTISFP